MKIVALVQARMGSTRLPSKVMRPISGQPMIELLLHRLSRSTRLDQIVLATSVSDNNDPLVGHVEKLGYTAIRGNENDVLGRYVDAASVVGADVVVRITGDCPLVDPELLDEMLSGFDPTRLDYLSNTIVPTYPDGLDIEIVTTDALRRAAAESSSVYDHEHVTPFIKSHERFRVSNWTNSEDLSALRWTVDEIVDFEVISNVFRHFAPNLDFTWQQVLALQRSRPDLFAANQTITRNEGASMGTGQKLWKRAKNVIPGGSMLLSKRAEMFLPEQWPAYFSKTKGCAVWDLDGRQYLDMSMMGIGTNTLGYSHPEVDAAVRTVVDDGNLSTLNCPEEVYLAERLVELHPWADMARFARSGGEANAIAIRIARAASGRDKVAFCGYHGWHDWYLAANLGDEKTLAGHLLPGLEPNGVPQELRGSVVPFNYNRVDELETATSANDVGVIFMEVSRSAGPDAGFLEKARKIATDRNMVLVFDECTSGFRQSFGGIHKLYGVEPDIATFGKTLGNGYAITSVIGRREVMEAAQTTFISSTFWTERIGPAAALKTLEVMERERSWERITEIGNGIRRRWQELADVHGLEIDHWGLPALCGFTIKSANAQAYKTLITQEMLAKGYLAGNSIYASLAHTEDLLDRFFDELAPVFKLIRECEDGRDVMGLLNGPVAHSGFKRLN